MLRNAVCFAYMTFVGHESSRTWRTSRNAYMVAEDGRHPARSMNDVEVAMLWAKTVVLAPLWTIGRAYVHRTDRREDETHVIPPRLYMDTTMLLLDVPSCDASKQI